MPTIGLALFFYGTRDVSDQNDVGNLLYNIAIIATFYLVSHLILDSFNGGVSLFYPLSTHRFPFVFDLVYQGGGFVPVVGVDIHEPSFGFEEGVTSLGVGILLTFVMGVFFSYRHNRYGDRNENLLQDGENKSLRSHREREEDVLFFDDHR